MFRSVGEITKNGRLLEVALERSISYLRCAYPQRSDGDVDVRVAMTNDDDGVTKAITASMMAMIKTLMTMMIVMVMAHIHLPMMLPSSSCHKIASIKSDGSGRGRALAEVETIILLETIGLIVGTWRNLPAIGARRKGP